MGSGNTDVGNRTPFRKAGKSIVKGSTALGGISEAPNTARTKRPALTGAMSQQCGDNGNFSTPQKFVQLVGCHDPKARAEPGGRPGPAKP